MKPLAFWNLVPKCQWLLGSVLIFLANMMTIIHRMMLTSEREGQYKREISSWYIMIIVRAFWLLVLDTSRICLRVCLLAWFSASLYHWSGCFVEGGKILTNKETLHRTTLLWNPNLHPNRSRLVLTFFGWNKPNWDNSYTQLYTINIVQSVKILISK